MTATPPVARVAWQRAVRIIRSVHPPIDLFEDIADPADWPLLIAAEQKTNPRLMATLGNLDLVPEGRRVAGPGASLLMAPFTHVSRDRPSRFSDGSYGVLYAGNQFEVALFETVFHHERFMRRTKESPGWTSQFRELVLGISGRLHDLRRDPAGYRELLDPDMYEKSQTFAKSLRASGSNGLVYPSVRYESGQCVGLFYPDLANTPVQGRHLDYYWNGECVEFYREALSGQVFRIS